jgi:HEAT repeat protein
MRFVTLFVSGLLVFCVGPGPARSQDKAPDKTENPPEITEVGGRPIEEWIKDISARDRSKGEAAIRTVLLFGPDRAYQAVPAILHELEKHKPPGVLLDTSIRINGTVALGAILSKAKEVDPKHVKEAIKILSRFLGDSQSIVKQRAAEALGLIGPAAKSAIPTLAYNSLKDYSTWETRQAAAAALGLISLEKGKAPSGDVLKALFGALLDSSFQVRLAAVKSITWLGGLADRPLKTRMVKVLNQHIPSEADASVRVWTHMAIMTIEQEVQPNHVAAIAQVLKHHDMGARIQAATLLGFIGPRAKNTVPQLIGALSDPQPAVVFASMAALTRMEQWADPAIPALKKIMEDAKRPEALKKAAAAAIEVIQKKMEKKSQG